jgi:hypothetical protein
MGTWGVVFLGIIALSSVVQAAFLLGLALQGRRLGKRLEDLQNRIDREIRPSIDALSRVSRNLAEASDLAVLQVRRFDGLLADTVDKVEQTTSLLRDIVLRPLGPLVDIVAFLKGIRRGIEVYQRLRGFERHERGVPRRHETDDEHLFI